MFLSYSQPYSEEQERFINEIKKQLKDKGLTPRTMGVTDYDMEEPLAGIRRVMMESNGLLTIAFRRVRIDKGVSNPQSSIPERKEEGISNKWLTSPYCHIEPAMAFQLGLPILVFREKGVIADGILQKGTIGNYMPEFDLYNNFSIEKYFKSDQWIQLIGIWEGYVRSVYRKKGAPPIVY